MIMKNTCYLIVLLLSISLAGSAQPDDRPGRGFQRPGGANLAGLKVAFVTKQLALTTDEAQKFWPVYYGYVAELRKTRQGKKDDVLAWEEDILNLRKKYKTEFKKILVADDRVNKALTVDRDFMNVVRKELQQRAKRDGKPKDLN
jgi:hypothetical protein